MYNYIYFHETIYIYIIDISMNQEKYFPLIYLNMIIFFLNTLSFINSDNCKYRAPEVLLAKKRSGDTCNWWEADMASYIYIYSYISVHIYIYIYSYIYIYLYIDIILYIYNINSLKCS